MIAGAIMLPTTKIVFGVGFVIGFILGAALL